MSFFLCRAQLLIALAALLPACDTDPTGDFEVTYAPAFDPSAFVSDITNPFFPLAPGTTFRYEKETDEGLEVVVVEVTDSTHVVAGVAARIVRDREYLDGELVEDTFDWFAQDADGNVWYLGEDTCEIENGECVSRAGSWEAGVDGARAGILMPAHPAVGQAYYQEFYEGEAEDRGEVVSTSANASVPYGSFTACVRTRDTTPLEPDVLEHKVYCSGVGLVLEEEGDERLELVDVTTN